MEVGKLDAARRLIDEAIRGHLRGDDPLSVHLSAFSAVRVTADLRKKRGLGQSLIDHLLPPDLIKEFWRIFYRTNSYLKHADNDADARINISGIEKANEVAVILAIENLGTLGVPSTDSFWMTYFRIAYLVQHPYAVSDEGRPWLDAVMPLWPEIEHGFIVELAQNPRAHAALLEKMQAEMQQMAAGVAH